MSYMSPLHFPHGYKIVQSEPEGWAKAFKVYTPNGAYYCSYAFIQDAVDYVESKRKPYNAWKHNENVNPYFIS